MDFKSSATKKLTHTLNGQALVIRKLPFGVALNADSDDWAASVVSHCLLYEHGDRVYPEIADVLEADADFIQAVTEELQGFSIPSIKEAEKN